MQDEDSQVHAAALLPQPWQLPRPFQRPFLNEVQNAPHGECSLDALNLAELQERLMQYGNTLEIIKPTSQPLFGSMMATIVHGVATGTFGPPSAQLTTQAQGAAVMPNPPQGASEPAALPGEPAALGAGACADSGVSPPPQRLTWWHPRDQNSAIMRPSSVSCTHYLQQDAYCGMGVIANVLTPSHCKLDVPFIRAAMRRQESTHALSLSALYDVSDSGAEDDTVVLQQAADMSTALLLACAVEAGLAPQELATRPRLVLTPQDAWSHGVVGVLVHGGLQGTTDVGQSGHYACISLRAHGGLVSPYQLRRAQSPVEGGERALHEQLSFVFLCVG